ncbi:MAG: ribosome biogenesis GTP-binding protein YihA/YsxC [Bacteroidaceae bacterium]|nr:ribosome biogenesis GTP-binding protein YihA/YsxC [Bacteroidaceae bacterium]
MQINSSEFLVSSPRVEQCPPTSVPEYAFIGRSNVGKSSLINMLTNHSRLAKTSSTPGKTLLINYFRINDQWHLVDLPGYGYAKRGKREQETLKRMISGYILRREQMTCLFVLIDVRLEPQRIDLDFITWLGENGVPFAIVFTKADKQSHAKTEASVSRFLQVLEEQWEELPPHFVTSSQNKLGRDELLDYIDGINRSMSL